MEEILKRLKPAKYKVGDLVLNGRAIVMKIHEKADRNNLYYLIHHIQDGEEEWLMEPFLDGTWDTLYLHGETNEIQDHYYE
jgi:hypothetical protein